MLTYRTEGAPNKEKEERGRRGKSPLKEAKEGNVVEEGKEGAGEEKRVGKGRAGNQRTLSPGKAASPEKASSPAAGAQDRLPSSLSPS